MYNNTRVVDPDVSIDDEIGHGISHFGLVGSGTLVRRKKFPPLLDERRRTERSRLQRSLTKREMGETKEEEDR